MSEKAAQAFAIYEAALGQTEGTGEWFQVDQERINQFADVTLDHQFIHIDPERAAQTPFGSTIAHGFLTLSLLVKLMTSVPSGDPAKFDGVMMGVNYGFDKVRFINPVKVDQRIRATSVLSAVELKGNQIQTTKTITVEIDGEPKPALVAEWITRAFYV